eukprot:TRINITY_DN3425_c0_g1_i1.p1 TRINITY_DN3425_c0_g1~~TRINITY_DN3425_c0_g1_i1.p1  ORF type:complete len:164 (+),score=2.94 TRINITY_DN3425_c0_g1_i1:55-546(+)
MIKLLKNWKNNIFQEVEKATYSEIKEEFIDFGFENVDRFFEIEIKENYLDRIPDFREVVMDIDGLISLEEFDKIEIYCIEDYYSRNKYKCFCYLLCRFIDIYVRKKCIDKYRERVIGVVSTEEYKYKKDFVIRTDYVTVRLKAGYKNYLIVNAQEGVEYAFLG